MIKIPSANVTEAPVSMIDTADFDELLRQYYMLFFPYQKFFRWLNYGDLSKKTFSHREFSFTLIGHNKSEIYLRYQSFADATDFRKEVLKISPIKMDIGAIFSTKPREHKTIKATAFQPVQKELVFDIDMTDYDDVRTCCSAANICNACWQFITIAMRILDIALRQDFGFKHLLWVYSGRRGVHCWVADERARKLSSEARSAIAEYLSVSRGGEQQSKKVYFPHGSEAHPSLQRAMIHLEQHFEDVVVIGQKMFSTIESCRKALDCLNQRALRDRLLEKWTLAEKTDQTLQDDDDLNGKKSLARWKELSGELLSTEPRFGRRIRQELIFQYAYPRLDINVSNQMHHLLKSPFCVHPKTGRVCVPIDVNKCNQFDPTKVPTIQDLCKQMMAFDDNNDDNDGGSDEESDEGEEGENGNKINKVNIVKNDSEEESINDGAKRRKLSPYKKTALKPYMKIFETFIRRVEQDLRYVAHQEIAF